MRPMVSGYDDLFHYFHATQQYGNSFFRPTHCPHSDCARMGTLHCHGHYFRKPDRDSSPNASLNPIPIFRFFCTACRRTCSVLPECIPPRRWHQWFIQSAALTAVLLQSSYRKAAASLRVSRRTVRRWLYELRERHTEFCSALRSRFSALGYVSNVFEQFWSRCLDKVGLAKAMLFLNTQEIIIP
jgi:transposase-like protein